MSCIYLEDRLLDILVDLFLVHPGVQLLLERVVVVLELVVQEVGGHVPRQQVEEYALVGALAGGNSIGLKTCRKVAQMSN